MATREALARGPEADNDDGGLDRRDHFTPLWKTKGAHSFGGGLLQPVPGAGSVPGSTLVESEGFVPLRKVCVRCSGCVALPCCLGWVVAVGMNCCRRCTAVCVSGVFLDTLHGGGGGL